jgi:hypothetical protein
MKMFLPLTVVSIVVVSVVVDINSFTSFGPLFIFLVCLSLINSLVYVYVVFCHASNGERAPVKCQGMQLALQRCPSSCIKAHQHMQFWFIHLSSLYKKEARATNFLCLFC